MPSRRWGHWEGGVRILAAKEAAGLGRGGGDDGHGDGGREGGEGGCHGHGRVSLELHERGHGRRAPTRLLRRDRAVGGGGAGARKNAELGRRRGQG